MTWRMLDQKTARKHGAMVPEDVIQVVCKGCPLGSLGYKEQRFCEAQHDYELDFFNEAIEYSTEDFDVRCTIRDEVERAYDYRKATYGKEVASMFFDEWDAWHGSCQENGGDVSDADAPAEDNN